MMTDKYEVIGIEQIESILEYESSLTDGTMCLQSSFDDIDICLHSGCSVGLIVCGKLVAYSLAYYNEYGIGFIEKSYVSHEYRCLGIQRDLIGINLKNLKKHNVVDVYTMVSPNNNASSRNLNTNGFRIRSRIECDGYERLLLVHNL